jgi:hypothetical protein
MEGAMVPLLRVAPLFFLMVAVSTPLPAQSRTAAIAGHVTDTTSKVIAGAAVRILGTPYYARTRDDGSFRIENLAAGTYRVRVTGFGFAADSTTVTVPSGGVAQVNAQLHTIAFALERVLSVANRMGETQAAALDRQKEATNLVTVLPGD